MILATRMESIPPTVEWVRTNRANVVARLEVADRAIAAGEPDTISHRLDEYRACVAELDAWITELDPTAAVAEMPVGCEQLVMGWQS